MCPTLRRHVDQTLDVRSDSRYTTTFASASTSGTVHGAFLHELKVIRRNERVADNVATYSR
jgi:hypothetical protein